MSVKSIFYLLAFATAVVTCVVLLAGVGMYSLSPGSEMCLQFGLWIGIAAVGIASLYGLWKLAVCTKAKLGSGFVCCALLLFMWISYHSMNGVREEIVKSKKYTIAAAELVENLPGGDVVIAQKSYTTEEYGRWEPFLAVLKRGFEPATHDKQRLSELSKSVNFDEVFLAHNLCDYESVSHTKKLLQTLKDEYEKSEAEQERCITSIEEGIKALLLEAKVEDNDGIELFGQELSGTRQSNKEYYRLEKAYLAEVSRLMGFLMSIHGFCSAEDGMIVFRKGSHERQYNRYVDKINELVKEASGLFQTDAAGPSNEIVQIHSENLLAAS